MKKVLLVVLKIALFSFAVSAEASTWHTAEIKRVYTLSNGDYILQFKSDSSACTSAETTDYYRISVGQNGVTQEGADKMYSAALSAGVAGKMVSIYFDSSTSLCYVNRLYIEM